jgi:hypothetical protein
VTLVGLKQRIEATHGASFVLLLSISVSYLYKVHFAGGSGGTDHFIKEQDVFASTEC